MGAAKNNNYNLKRKVRPQYTEEELDELCEGLVDWAYNSDDIFITSFTYEKCGKKTQSWIYNLASRHKKVKQALEDAREALCAKLGKHCYIGDRNSSFGEKMLSMHSKEYRDHQKHIASLSKPELTEKDTQIIVKTIDYARSVEKSKKKKPKSKKPAQK